MPFLFSPSYFYNNIQIVAFLKSRNMLHLPIRETDRDPQSRQMTTTMLLLPCDTVVVCDIVVVVASMRLILLLLLPCYSVVVWYCCCFCFHAILLLSVILLLLLRPRTKMRTYDIIGQELTNQNQPGIENYCVRDIIGHEPTNGKHPSWVRTLTILFHTYGSTGHFIKYLHRF